jgi:hypothetical protein
LAKWSVESWAVALRLIPADEAFAPNVDQQNPAVVTSQSSSAVTMDEDDPFAEEIHLEPEQLLRQAIQRILADGVVTDQEKAEIQSLRRTLGIAAEIASRLFQEERARISKNKTASPAPTAVINKIWIEENIKRSGVNGVVIHVDFTTENFLGVKALVRAFPEFVNGHKLRDSNGSFSVGGQVCVTEPLLFITGPTECKDFMLFLPRDELHLDTDRTHRCRLLVTICLQAGSQQELAKSGYTNFAVAAAPSVPAIAAKNPTIQFGAMSVAYGVRQDDAVGIRINAHYRIADMAGQRGQVNAYFEFADGTELRDADGSYCSRSGQVAVCREVAQHADKEEERELDLFIPISQLHLVPDRDHECRFCLRAWR